ncbi:MAG: hypothetical protein U0R50_07325 [Gaiellales bacterium]
MAATGQERYVVASCHVERLLDDRVWAAYSALLRARPGELPVASLVRPPDPAAGENEDVWRERVQALIDLGAPFGHHTHWTSPTHARPTGGDPDERVQREGAWLRALGLRPTLFCGGGWYTDARVAEACAELGYADCTPRATRPSYLAADAPWAQLASPARVLLPAGGELVAVPTTHSVGDALRAVVRPSLPTQLHVYFHDTDLVDSRRRRLVTLALRFLGARGRAADLDTIRNTVADDPVAWDEIGRP